MVSDDEYSLATKPSERCSIAQRLLTDFGPRPAYIKLEEGAETVLEAVSVQIAEGSHIM